MVHRLSGRLDLLKGFRDADPRQHTLRATIEWSFDLLTPGEQALFAQLSVFRGGCTVEDAEAVLDADLDTLQSLVDKSLVRHANARFSMLETIAQFAGERLSDRSDRDQLMLRHAEHFLALLDSAAPHMRYQSKAWLDRVEAELDNVRAALDDLTARGETQLVLRFVSEVWWLWMWRGYLDEGRSRIEAALAADPRPTEARAAALLAAADICSDLGDLAAGLRYCAESRALFDGQPDSHSKADLDLCEALIHLLDRNLPAAEPLLRDALAGYVRLGDRHTARETRRRLAWMHELAGDVELSTKLHEENLADAIADGDGLVEATTKGVLSGRAIDAGRHADALSLASDALRMHRELNAQYDVTVDLHRFARILVATGRPEDALILVGAITELYRLAGRPLDDWVEDYLTEIRRDARPALDDERAARAEARGAALDLDAAADFALSSCAHLHAN
jgi:hypothetical protein